MRRITSRQNSIVARYRTIARDGDRTVLLLDGTHLVRDALAADIHVEHIFVDAEAATRSDIAPLLERARARRIDVAIGSAPVMSAVSPVRSTSPIVALARRPSRADRLFASDDPFIMIACDVQDPGNLGAIVRVAEAAGASGVMAAGRTADPFGWKAIRGSMGSALRLPIGICETGEAAVASARHHGCRIVATAPRGGQPLFSIDLTGAVAILIGGEGQGLSDELLGTADVRVTIPMQPPVESLNAAMTAAVVAYESRRHRS